MSEITINGLLQEAGPIRDATNDNENTALKVGNMFIHIIQYLLRYQNSIESGGGNSSDDLGQLTPINLGLILADLDDLNSYPENNDLVLVWNHTSNSGWDFLPYGGGSQVPGLLGTGDVTWQQLGRAPEPNTQQIDLGHLDLSAYTKNTDSWWGNTPSTLLNGTHVVTGSLRGGIQYIRFDRSVTSGGTTTDYLVYLGLDENGNLRLSHNENGTGSADFYAIGGVSALGNSSGGSGGGSDSESLNTPLNNLLTDLNRIADGFGSNDTYYTIKKGSSGWTLELDSLSKLNDVSYNGTPSNGQYLVYNNGNWTNASASPNSGSGISIAVLSSALSWNTETTLATLTTGGSTYSIKAKLPSLPTDEKVKLSYVSNTNSNYPILFSNTPNLNSPAPVTESVNRSDNNLYYNPSTETLTVANISGKATSAGSADNATNATTATKLGSTTIGSNIKPIYLSSGTPTASDGNVGTTSRPVYLANGTITQCGTTLGVDISGNAATASKFESSRILWGNLDDGDNDIGKSGDNKSLSYVQDLSMYGTIAMNTKNSQIQMADPTGTTKNVLNLTDKNQTDVYYGNTTKAFLDVGYGCARVTTGDNKSALRLWGNDILFKANGSDNNNRNTMILTKEGSTYLPLATTGPKSGNTYTGAGPAAGLRIGDAVLYWDEANQALALAKYNTSQPSSPTAANFYATGGVSALGMSSGSGSVPAMTFGNLTVNNKLSFNSSSAYVIAGQNTQALRVFSDADTNYIELFYDYDNSKISSTQYYFTDYCNVGIKGELGDGIYKWSIDPDGCASFSRVYLSDNAYIYFDSNNVKLKIGTNTYTLTKQ